MALKYGVKIWSINHDLIPLAASFSRNGSIDATELYIVPGKVDRAMLEPLRGTTVFIHAPHENHGFDMNSLLPKQEHQFKNEVITTADYLNAEFIVVHAGVGSDEKTFARNLKKIDDPRIIIENMPKEALGGGTCFGYDLLQLKKIKELTGKRFCIDIGHAVKSAVSQGLDPKEFLNEIFTVFAPDYFHISDGDTGTLVDEHLDLGTGNYDLPWIRSRIESLARDRDVQLVFEVPKNGKDLGNDLENIEKFKRL